MAVVKNLMIRIGADFSAARKGMQGATSELNRFKRDTTRTTNAISGKQGLGGIGKDFKSLGSTVTSSLSQIRGAKGIGGVATSMRSLVPVAGAATAGLRGLGAAATGASAALGPVGIGIAVVTAAIALATVGIYKASQTAVKFESDLGRLNMQLKGGAKDFMAWSRAQGLAKSTSAELGATYSVLLSSFGFGNKQLLDETKKITQATRVVASATGKTIEDTLERMRSGLLGNTEAIEDLGIFVGVSMIESTKAFKQFANGKSWDQLEFRIQQQIRLAAILEQAYARYGDKLQNNVMTKQERLMEQLKDIKLNLSQAFLPIWDSVLPALTRLATDVAKVTETIARFFYRIKGWDYDALTKGSDKQTDAVNDQGNAYDDLGKSAKKARTELAAFDQLNLIGDAGNGSGSGGSSSGTPGGNNNSGDNKPPGSDINLPKIPIPPELIKKWRIEFDPPTPPDAGAGGVAVAVVNTINGLIAEAKQKMNALWDDIKVGAQVGITAQQPIWAAFATDVKTLLSNLRLNIVTDWKALWTDLATQTQTGSAGLTAAWAAMLSGMLADLKNNRVNITAEWDQLKATLLSLQNPLSTLRVDWHNTLDYMQSQVNAYQPYISWGIYLVSQALMDLQGFASTLAGAWEMSWANIWDSTQQRLQPILSAIGSITSAWSSMLSKVMQPITLPSIQFPEIKIPDIKLPDIKLPNIDLPDFSTVFDGIKDSNLLQQIKDAIPYASKQTLEMIKEVAPMMIGGGGLAATGKAGMGALKGLIERLLKDAGKAIPAFATGGAVFGPTLAMVGDNPGARTDPEIIAPQSMIAEAVNGGGNDEELSVLRAILRAVSEDKTVQAVISQTDVGRASVNYINSENRRGNNPLLGL